MTEEERELCRENYAAQMENYYGIRATKDKREYIIDTLKEIRGIFEPKGQAGYIEALDVAIEAVEGDAYERGYNDGVGKAVAAVAKLLKPWKWGRE